MRLIDADRLAADLQETAEDMRGKGEKLHADVLMFFAERVRKEETVEEWIPVKERLPADPKQRIEFVHGVGKRRVADMGHCGKDRRDNWYSDTQKCPIPAWSVTHWRHVPEIPKEE